MSSSSSNDNQTIEQQVLRQVEFYFSDSNLPRDRFLRSLVANDERGYVSIDTIASFKRMRQITENKEEVVNALKKSTMLEVDETGTLVRRSTPLPQEDTFDARSVYAKGLPLDSTIDSVQSFFQKFGTVQSVRLRRHHGSKDFKGSVLIEFDSIDKAQEVAKMEIKYNESDENNLQLKMKKEWEQEKNEYQQKRKESKKQAAKKEEKPEITEEDLKKNLTFDKDCLVKITNIGTASDVTYNNVKDELLKIGEVKYVDFPYCGDKTVAIARYSSPDAAKATVDKLATDKLSLGGSEIQVTLATAEEQEKFFLDMAIANLKKQNDKKRGFGKSNRGRKHGGGGKNWGGSKKRKASDSGSQGAAKVAKQE